MCNHRVRPMVHGRLHRVSVQVWDIAPDVLAIGMLSVALFDDGGVVVGDDGRGVKMPVGGFRRSSGQHTIPDLRLSERFKSTWRICC